MTTPATAEALTRTWQPRGRLDLHLTLGQLQRGRSDPTYRITPDGSVWRTSRTPHGPCTLRVHRATLGGPVHAQAWGPGASWQLHTLPALLGDADHDLAEAFTAHHARVRDAAARHPGLRLTRTGLVLSAMVPAVLEQKVTTLEAHRAYRWLLTRHGEHPPGPAPEGMRVVPTAETWARIPSWDWHRAGVDAKRSRTVVQAARVSTALERTAALPGEQASRTLRSLPGIGVWTVAETLQRSHGDPDALSVGDLHLSNTVGHALVGRRLDDAGMLELLAPYTGQRHRAALLIRLSGVRVPRRAPRFAPRDFRAM